MDALHGGDIYSFPNRESLLDLSVNVNPLGMPASAAEAAKKAVDQCICYPDTFCRELRTAIAGREGVLPEQVLCGNGAADLIFRVAFGLRPAKALVLAPTFSEYRQALEASGRLVAGYPLHPDNGFQVDEKILNQLTGCDMVLLCNPNNPTGRTVSPDLLDRIIDAARNNKAIVLIDECFIDFLHTPDVHTAKRFLPRANHVLVLKAFTKLYSMAGLRLGYLIGDPLLLERINKAGPPWNVSIPAQAAGIAALTEEDWITRTRELITSQREWLTARLRKLGLWVCPGEANYLLFRCEEELDLQAVLLERDILIRRCANYEGLDGRYYRIAVRTQSENRRFIQALASVLE